VKAQIMEHPQLVVVRTFGNRIEAELAHSALEAAEIDSTIVDDDAGGTQPELWLRGVKLLVREDDAERATEILGPSA
jgi:putative signal transducing protein